MNNNDLTNEAEINKLAHLPYLAQISFGSALPAQRRSRQSEGDAVGIYVGFDVVGEVEGGHWHTFTQAIDAFGSLHTSFVT